MTASNRSKFFCALIQALLPQLVLFAFVSVLYILASCHVIPSPQVLNEKLVEAFKSYGLPLVAICSFVENFIGINAYFPGAFTILTGMALTAGNPVKALITYFAIYLPALAANMISFVIGSYAQKSPRVKAANKNQRNIILWFILTYWHPQLASVTAFSAGVEKELSPKQFIAYSLFISLGWSIFWALIIYRFGLSVNVGNHFATMFVFYLICWTIYDIWKFCKGRQFVLECAPKIEP